MVSTLCLAFFMEAAPEGFARWGDADQLRILVILLVYFLKIFVTGFRWPPLGFRWGPPRIPVDPPRILVDPPRISVG